MNSNESLSRDALIEMMLDAWAEHRADGKRRGIDHRHEWQTEPEWAHRDAEDWARMDMAWRTLIGARLANAAIEKYEGRFDGD